MSIEEWRAKSSLERVGGGVNVADEWSNGRCGTVNFQNVKLHTDVVNRSRRSSHSSDETQSMKEIERWLSLSDDGDRSPRLSEESHEVVSPIGGPNAAEDPFDSILDMIAQGDDGLSLVFDDECTKSITEALDSVVHSIHNGHSVEDPMLRAYAVANSRAAFEQRPSPLGSGHGNPALQSHGLPGGPPAKVPMPSAFFHSMPRRVISKERQEQLDRYRAKRERRLLGLKKPNVRYECRKTLAKSFPRVKGRFVKVDDKAAMMKSVQSCPDLSALANDDAKSTKDPSEIKIVRESCRRSQDDEALRRISAGSSSSKSSVEHMDFDRMMDRYAGIPQKKPVGFVKDGLGGLQSSSLRHCQSEICLASLAEEA